jgi:hypothetical protein
MDIAEEEKEEDNGNEDESEDDNGRMSLDDIQVADEG